MGERAADREPSGGVARWTAERWRRLDRLFRAALERPPGEVEAFLESACGDDPRLRREVVSLIAAHRRTGDSLEDAVQAEARDLIGDPSPHRIGRRIGAYRVIRSLGQGGTSTVFLAGRADARFDKAVAIKVIKRGMDTEEVLRRFRQERQILASLDHPHIARLLDAATTEDGLPAFVMEYVEGTPIGRYCDAHRLPVRARIDLLRSVCSAVHYAHQNLVVHRDLKPSNILVTVEGVPKLLDFGIAKLLDPQGSAHTAVATALAARAMTPEYASPEQVRGGAITTASDVYSLGVLLYELLTGRRPYRFTRGGAAEVERVVCEVEPARPSVAVGQRPDPAGEPDAVSPPAGESRARLGRRLSGDLDNIVLKALAKEPSRRYASAEQLSEDLRRHLAGLPVGARQDTVGYRVVTFVRRHRAGVAAAALVAAAVLTSAGIALWQARAATVARARAEIQRDHAERISGFLGGLFEVSDPSESRGSTITARELLDRGAERIARLEGPPETEARLMTTMGQIYRKLGLYDSAVPLLEGSLERLRRAPATEAEARVKSLNELALVRFHKGEFAEAEAVYRRASEVAARGLGASHPERAASLNGLALTLDAKGDLLAAEPLYRQALALTAGESGAGGLVQAESLNGLGLLLFRKGDHHAAEPLLRRALELRRRLLGGEHQDVAQCLHNLAAVLYGQGDYAAAEPVAREALALRRQLLGDDHPESVRSLNTLAALHFARGSYSQAEPLYRRLLTMRRRALGEDHPQVANGLNNLARVLAAQGRHAEAEPLYRQALERKERLLGAEHPRMAVSLHGLAAVLHARGAAAEAEPLYRRALELRRRHLVAEYPGTGESLVGLGRLLSERGGCPEAEPLLREGLAILQGAVPADDPGLTAAQAALDACRALGGSARSG